MKRDKKPLIIILVIIITIIAGLLLANYMFKQVDIQLDKKESAHSYQYEEQNQYSIIEN